MRKIHLLLLIIWTLLFSACKDKAFKEFESGDYILGYSVIIDNSYTIGNRDFVIPEYLVDCICTLIQQMILHTFQYWITKAVLKM